MKHFRVPIVCILALSLLAFVSCSMPPKGSPVALYGKLSVKGSFITDSKGNPVQLRGVSTMGLQWYGGIVNQAAFHALSQDWKADVIRLALYVGENGYATKPELKETVKAGIELAIKEGLYVIVDWHVLSPGNPNDPIYSGVDDFFKEIAKEYGTTPNLIYEIMNEPNGELSWGKDLKPYAQRLVNEIRALDRDNLIMIGSGTWSQDVDGAAADPVEGTGLVYTAHFYAGTHGQELRDKIQKAVDLGAPVFVSEWGTSLANGSGGPFINKSEEWAKFLDERKIGWVSWSLSNKNETSALFKGLLQEFVEGKGSIVTQEETPLVPAIVGPGGYPVWTTGQLSITGAYIRAKLRGESLPTYPFVAASWTFGKDLEGWMIPPDSGAKPELKHGTAEDGALTFQGDWTDGKRMDTWSTAPRLKIADVGIDLTDISELTLDLYLEEGKGIEKAFEVNPVLQYPPSWWNQLLPIRVEYKDGKSVGNGLLKFQLTLPLKGITGKQLGHLLLIVVGNGTDYKGKVAIDNIALHGSSNGDASGAGAVAADDPGTFTSLPWDFEKGGRQGWTVCDDSPAKVNLSIANGESKALSFSFGWTIPGPKDPWNAAPRVSSSFINVPAKDYKAVSFDFYMERGKTDKGNIEVQPVIQSPQHGYWFQLPPVKLDFSKGIPVTKNLMKYSIQVPIESSGIAMKPDAIIRNLILLTVGIETDYQGLLMYDNVNLVK